MAANPPSQQRSKPVKLADLCLIFSFGTSVLKIIEVAR